MPHWAPSPFALVEIDVGGTSLNSNEPKCEKGELSIGCLWPTKHQYSGIFQKDRRHRSCEEAVMYTKGSALGDAVAAVFIVSLDGLDKCLT
ncbi:hypothetical protein PanWU01x14_267340 [Parasponia andersonii]|uniref:Uncharacterized protein n=1 Tax=Parasponia andersonii TaxID=3476 RepID=A0A2P5B6E9_PARAD|nr:hypothetical protein PanWU01x14_267340 [Parasponia andersonii]